MRWPEASRVCSKAKASRAAGGRPLLGTRGLVAPTLLATQRLLMLPTNYAPLADRHSTSSPPLTQAGVPWPPILQHTSPLTEKPGSPPWRKEMTFPQTSTFFAIISIYEKTGIFAMLPDSNNPADKGAK